MAFSEALSKPASHNLLRTHICTYIALADTKEIGFFPSSHMCSSVFSFLSVILDSTYSLPSGPKEQDWHRSGGDVPQGERECQAVGFLLGGFLHTYIHIIPLALLATSSQALASHVHTYRGLKGRHLHTQTTGAGAEKRLLPILALVLGPSGGAMA